MDEMKCMLQSAYHTVSSFVLSTFLVAFLLLGSHRVLAGYSCYMCDTDLYSGGDNTVPVANRQKAECGSPDSSVLSQFLVECPATTSTTDPNKMWTACITGFGVDSANKIVRTYRDCINKQGKANYGIEDGQCKVSSYAYPPGAVVAITQRCVCSTPNCNLYDGYNTASNGSLLATANGAIPSATTSSSSGSNAGALSPSGSTSNTSSNTGSNIGSNTGAASGSLTGTNANAAAAAGSAASDGGTLSDPNLNSADIQQRAVSPAVDGSKGNAGATAAAATLALSFNVLRTLCLFSLSFSLLSCRLTWRIL